jgi:hypothetical protein
MPGAQGGEAGAATDRLAVITANSILVQPHIF